MYTVAHTKPTPRAQEASQILRAQLHSLGEDTISTTAHLIPSHHSPSHPIPSHPSPSQSSPVPQAVITVRAGSLAREAERKVKRPPTVVKPAHAGRSLRNQLDVQLPRCPPRADALETARRVTLPHPQGAFTLGIDGGVLRHTCQVVQHTEQAAHLDTCSPGVGD